MSKCKKYIKWFEIVIDCIVVICSFIFLFCIYWSVNDVWVVGGTIVFCFVLKEWIHKYLVSTEIKKNRKIPSILVIILFISAFAFTSSISGEIQQTIDTIKNDFDSTYLKSTYLTDILVLQITSKSNSKRILSNEVNHEVYVESLIRDVHRLEYQINDLEDELEKLKLN